MLGSRLTIDSIDNCDNEMIVDVDSENDSTNDEFDDEYDSMDDVIESNGGKEEE